ncbi:MAG: hypothetical protein GXP09_07795 [Gammaproteobacteria bacterium]|nr:hypothetical protein [Gammaproteobacteria bacterium]
MTQLVATGIKPASPQTEHNQRGDFVTTALGIDTPHYNTMHSSSDKGRGQLSSNK